MSFGTCDSQHPAPRALESQKVDCSSPEKRMQQDMKRNMSILAHGYARRIPTSFLVQILRVDPPTECRTSSHGWVAHGTGRSMVCQQLGSLCLDLAQRTLLRSSRVCNSGLSPPCIQRNCLFMIAARGNAQKDSMQAS